MSTEKHTLNITVQSTRGTRSFELPKTATVQDVIATAASAFGFAAGDTFVLVLATDVEHPLDSHRTLVSLHVEDGTTFILTATGTGV